MSFSAAMTARSAFPPPTSRGRLARVASSDQDSIMAHRPPRPGPVKRGPSRPEALKVVTRF